MKKPDFSQSGYTSAGSDLDYFPPAIFSSGKGLFF